MADIIEIIPNRKFLIEGKMYCITEIMPIGNNKLITLSPIEEEIKIEDKVDLDDVFPER